jgi:uncharacterized alpha-E superfamily protein
MQTHTIVDELRHRLLSSEPDGSLRRDIGTLVVSRLETTDQLSYCMKDNLVRSIAALNENAKSARRGIQHAKLWYALLQYQLSLLGEEEREDGHRHPDEIIEALTREMLLEAALKIV